MRLLPLLGGIAMLACALAACDQSSVIPTSPASASAVDSNPWVPSKDTSRKDTVTVVYAKLFPTVDSMRYTFVPVVGGNATRSWKITRKATDTVARLTLDTGTGRIWRFSATGYKNGRTWWLLDSVRVKPDSSRRIVLDSFYKRLKIADTTTPIVVPPVAKDTLPIVQVSALAGDPNPKTGEERGLFFTYSSSTGNLVAYLSSDGDVNDTSKYNRVFGAQLAMAFSGETAGSPTLIDIYNGVSDNDSTSTLVAYDDSANALKALTGKIYSRFRLKTLTIPVAKCTVEVAISFSQGVQTNAPGWKMSNLASDSLTPLIFLGAKRTHPTKAHFKIVIP